MNNTTPFHKVITQGQNPYESGLSKLQTYLLREAILLDVRTAQEYIKTKLPNSRHAPIEQLIVLAKSIRNWNKPVITYSTHGRRSAQAEQLLRSLGVEAVNGGSRSDLAKIIYHRSDLPARH